MGYRTTNRFGREVKKEMAAKGIGLRELSRQTGISPGYLSLFLSAERNPPSPELIGKINDALGITTPKLFWLAGYVPQDDRRYDALIQRLKDMDDTDIDKLLAYIDGQNRKQRR